MCTCFVDKRNDLLIGMNFDNNGMKFELNTSIPNSFIVDIYTDFGKQPSFNINSQKTFVSNLSVDTKIDYNAGKKCTYCGFDRYINVRKYLDKTGGTVMINFVFGIFGIIGGVLCAIGDMLFDLKGKNNVKSGHPKIIDSNWQIMSEWRFKASIFFAALGVPLYLLGFWGMTNHLAQSNRTVAITFLVFSVVGASGGLFIHALVCIMPIISKTLTKNGVNNDMTETICIKIYNTVKIPFITMFLSLVIATSIILIYAIIRNYLYVPFIFVVLNPLGLMLIGWLFRLINKDIFSDLPGIIMPSIGIAMIGLMTALTAVIL